MDRLKIIAKVTGSILFVPFYFLFGLTIAVCGALAGAGYETYMYIKENF